MIILSGWSSKSKYRLIGSIRSIAITLRYEIVASTMVIGIDIEINDNMFNVSLRIGI